MRIAHARLIYAAALLAVTVAAQAQAPFSVRVKLDVGGDVNPTTNMVTSRISTRLRSVSGVVVSPDNPDRILSVMALATSSRGDTTGYVMSVAVLRPPDWKLFELLLKGFGSNPTRDVTDDMAVIRTVFADLVQVGARSVRVGPDLEELCGDLVADFDVSELEPLRLAHQQALDRAKQK